MLNWSGNCVTTITRGNITFKINNTKLYMTVIFWQKFDKNNTQKINRTRKSGFERVLSWSKYFTKNINQTITANTEDDANIDCTVDSATQNTPDYLC